ncbi:phage tail tube protein [Salinisphaera sp. LB1]|uniref:phage tail tube protein n=1 Tax=Salinisphaera sp. LB1 TaxID=2183911 RepID=UPI000D707F06|nr:phage tail tube protein [Salinisphaera sp. LB1]
MTQAIRTQGIILEISDASGTGTYSKVAEVTGFDGPNGSTNVIDATSLDSQFAEKIGGLRDSGQVSVDLNFVPGDTSQQAVRDAYGDAEKRDFRITLTDVDQTTIEFSALVTEFSISASADDKVTASTTLEITGGLTWGNASAG